jgi:hypothetical protein
VSPELITAIAAAATAIVTLLASIAILAWWLAKQFQYNRHTFYGTMKQMEVVFIDKLDEHEQRDAHRFEAVNKRIDELRDDLWEIRVRNAERDGAPKPPRP